jgi:hypothetical protein
MQQYLKIGHLLQNNNQYDYLSFFLMFICLFSGYSQNLPRTSKTPTRLFYIQHSDNHNTYVYDANIKAGIIDSSQPINTYRIVYTKNGIKNPCQGYKKNSPME